MLPLSKTHILQCSIFYYSLVNGTEAPVARNTLVPHVVGTEAPVARDTLVPPVNGTEVPVAHNTLVPPVNGTEVPVARNTLVPPVNGTEVPVARNTLVPPVNGTKVPVARNTLVPRVVGTEAPVARDTLIPPVNGTEAPVARVTLVPCMERTEVPVAIDALVQPVETPVPCDTLVPPVDRTEAPVVRDTLVPCMDRTQAADTLVPCMDRTEAPVARDTLVHPADETQVPAANSIILSQSVDSAHASMSPVAKATLGHHTHVHEGEQPPLAGDTLTSSFQVVDIPQDVVPMQLVRGTHLSTAETVSMNQPPSSEHKDIPMPCPMVFDSDDSSGSDFIPPKFKARKRKHNICSKNALPVNECPSSLKPILPQSTEYSYIIEEFTESEPLNDTPNFEATVRINISDKQQADKWLQDFMTRSKCTYRVTKSTNPAMKRVLAKYVMHCQHFRKALTPKQVQAKFRAATNRKKNPLVSGIRNKKTNCPSRLTLTINVPPKAKTNPYLSSHMMGLLKLDFCHNHSVHSAHTLSFQPISEATKEQIFNLFSKGHSAASARTALETELVLKCTEQGTEVQRVLADRSLNPTVQDYSRLYSKWRDSEMGQENGPSMFAQLEKEIESYNSQGEGKAMLQVYQARESNQKINFQMMKTAPLKESKG